MNHEINLPASGYVRKDYFFWVKRILNYHSEFPSRYILKTKEGEDIILLFFSLKILSTQRHVYMYVYVPVVLNKEMFTDKKPDRNVLRQMAWT